MERLPTSSHHEPEPCSSNCSSIATERNRYYTGKYMTARDFQDEQTYFLSRHRLHTRLLHGWGIVCGLEVNYHPDKKHDLDTECARRWVVVNPGIAFDCCGREIVVPKRMFFELPLPRYPKEETAEEAEQSPSARVTASAYPPSSNDADVMEGQFLLGICYEECAIEKVPALYAEGACDPQRLEANRVREGVRLVVRRLDQVQDDCWRDRTSEGETRCRDDCEDGNIGPTGACMDPSCPCGGMVPLALVRPPGEQTDYRTGFQLDDLGRRYVGSAPELLTHIVAVNWTHGAEITLSHLRDQMGGQLKIYFDRKLRTAQGEATGINAETFIVQDRDEDDAMSFVLAAEESPPQLAEDGCVAVFTIDPRELRPRGENIAGNVIYVMLKCDFVLDCHGSPVDGNFLGGNFPTGDGVKGGTFESWFSVVPG